MDMRIFHIEQSLPTYEEATYDNTQPPSYEVISHSTQQRTTTSESVENVCEVNPQMTDRSCLDINPERNYPNPSYNLKQYFWQIKTMRGGFLLLFVSGLHIGWGIWRQEFTEPWISEGVNGLFIFLVLSWYVAAIIGGLLGAVMVERIEKKIIYCISGTILAISSAIFIIWYNEQVAILVGRFIAGIGHGIIYNVARAHIAENADKEHRVHILTSVNITISAAVFVAATSMAVLPYVQMSYRIIGIIGLICSLTGIAFTIAFNVESVQYLLRRQMNLEAANALVKLRRRTGLMGWSKVVNEILEIESMIVEQSSDNQNIFANSNGSVIFYINSFTIAANLGNNILLNVTMMSMVADILNDNGKFAPVILTLVRFIVSMTPLITTAVYRRSRIPTMISGLIVVGILVTVLDSKLKSAAAFYAKCVMCILIQILAGLGTDPMQHVCIAEVFPICKKAWSMTVISSFENIFQMSMIGIFFIGNEVSRVTMLTTLGVTGGFLFFFSAFVKWPKNSINRTLEQTTKDALQRISCVGWYYIER